MYRKKNSCLKSWKIATIITISFLLLFVIYCFPPCKLICELQLNETVTDKYILSTSNLTEMMQADQRHVSAELLMRTKENSNWVLNKFILIGSLIGALFIYAFKESEKEFVSIIRKKFFTVTVALAFVLAVIIDIQLRQNILVVMQLGNWVAHQYEPWMSKTISDKDSLFLKNMEDKEDITKSINSKIPLGWESFLRISVKERPEQGEKKDESDKESLKSLKSTHLDDFYSFFHFPAFHILTWLLYGLFLFSFYTTTIVIIQEIEDNKIDSETIQRNRITLDFILVITHVSIIFYAIMSRAQSGIFEVKIFPWITQ